MITNKFHEKIVNQLKEQIALLVMQLREAKDLKDILTAVVRKTETLATKDFVAANFEYLNVSLPDNYLHYVDDYFGGKVIKQEATDVTILDEKGKATYGVTRQKADKGKKYKLVIK